MEVERETDKKNRITLSDVVDTLDYSNKVMYNHNEHPYKGLRDALGSITRYSPKKLINRNWIKEYLDLGGKLKDMNVRDGIDPSATTLEKYKPSTIVRWLKEIEDYNKTNTLKYNWNHINTLKIELIDNEDKDSFIDVLLKAKTNTYTKMFNAFGIETLPNIALYSREARYQYIADNMITVPKNFKINLPNVIGTIYEEDSIIDVASHIIKNYESINPIFNHFNTCYKKYVKRIKRNRCNNEEVKYTTKRVLEMALKLSFSKNLNTTQRNKISNILCKARYSFNRTNAGTIICFNDIDDKIYTGVDSYGLRPNTNYNLIEHTPKTIGQYKVYLLNHYITNEKIYFVYDKDTSFDEHVEGESIKDCISKLNDIHLKLEKAKIIKGKEMSLSDVIEVKHFCLPGTKQWLQSKFKHIYTLLEPYDKWVDVPKEIMEIKWSFTDRDLFDNRF